MVTQSRQPWNKFALLGALVLAIASGLLIYEATVAASGPDDGTDAVGVAVSSLIFMAIFCAAGSIALLAYAIWRRGHPVRLYIPAGWYADPQRETSWRYWDGSNRTGHVA